MKGFAGNLINRHISTEANIMPRLRGRFEPEQNAFHEDINPAPVNAIDTFSERTRADDSIGPDTTADTPKYRPVIPSRPTAYQRQQPDPEPEQPAQVSFSVTRPAFSRPAAFEVTPAAENFKPGDKRSESEENAAQMEPVLPISRPTATPNRHDFNTNSPANAAMNNQSGMVWPKSVAQESGNERGPFAGQRKSTAAPKVTPAGSNPSAITVNEGVQPVFKNLNTVIQNNVSPVSPAYPGNGNLGDAGKRSFQQTAQPVIKVTIGRIEVKAVHPQAPAPVQRREPQKPMLTLDDFLSQHKRNGQ